MSDLAGRYRLGTRIASGGMADVYRATDARLGRPVAVKVFRAGTAIPDARDRLASEVRLLAGLNQPNLVAIYDADLGAAEPYIVMELVDGRSLAQELADHGPLAPGRTARLGAQIAQALAYVHARGVVHRDVKPGNVLLTPADEVKVADFGIARLVDDAGITAPGLLIGTAAYLAPEQVRAAPVTTAADLYSLGLVLLECLTGHRAYDGTAAEVAVARLHRRPEVPATVGAGWAALLTAMTADAAADRPSAGAVAERLTALAAGGATPTAVLPTALLSAADRTAPDRPAAVPLPVRPRRRRGLIAVLATLLVAGGIAAAAALASRPAAPPAPRTTPAVAPAAGSTSTLAAPTTSAASPTLSPPVSVVRSPPPGPGTKPGKGHGH